SRAVRQRRDGREARARALQVLPSRRRTRRATDRERRPQAHHRLRRCQAVEGRSRGAAQLRQRSARPERIQVQEAAVLRLVDRHHRSRLEAALSPRKPIEMSIHSSLRGVDTLKGERSVFTRVERIAILKKAGKFKEEESNVLGLPKVRTRYKVA